MTIKDFIKARIDTDFVMEEDLPFATFQKQYKKNDIITRYGQTEKYAYFLLSGIMKISIIRQEQEERILEFFFPGSFLSSYTSFLTQQVSDVQIEALADCEVEVIKHADMQMAYKSSVLANKLGRLVAEGYYIKKTNREKRFLTLTATERYQNLLNVRPELVQQIPVHQIAKYLGIEPESLSRIRKMRM